MGGTVSDLYSGRPFAVMKAGITETRLTAARNPKTFRIALRKSARLTLFCPPDTPANMLCRVDRGISVAMIAKAIPRLRRDPTLKRVEDIPPATPLLCAGTLFIIEEMLGATKSPAPNPTRSMGGTRKT